MTGLKKILNKIFVFLVDIILLTIDVIKHIVLPNRKRKGNILNSILVFFIGLIEILNHFEYGFFQMSKIFEHRYIRQGVIIITAFLFLLSSLEWTRGQGINIGNSSTTAIQSQPKAFKSISFKKVTKATNWLKRTSLAFKPLANICLLPDTLIHFPSIKSYLLIRSILI